MNEETREWMKEYGGELRNKNTKVGNKGMNEGIWMWMKEVGSELRNMDRNWGIQDTIKEYGCVWGNMNVNEGI